MNTCLKYLGSGWIDYHFPEVNNVYERLTLYISQHKQLNKSEENYNDWASRFCMLKLQFHEQFQVPIPIQIKLNIKNNKIATQEFYPDYSNFTFSEKDYKIYGPCILVKY